MSKDAVAVVIKGVMPTTNGCAVFLGNEQKTFLIYVDQSVGSAIQMCLAGIKKDRPLTHDLIGNILLGLEAKVEHVLINDTKNGTYYARITLQMSNELGRKIVEIDARPSDSIVLALQFKRTIYVNRKVYDSEEDRTEILQRVLRQQSEQADD
ncbi:MAG: bifunctional nuclease family protein [Cephaloticoccus sp.]|nr:bifunctional nuclease family protein [Cephaloticoccus sp.]MCF7760025.1 bifunctional nuclease family protein [Cephaloticoccus sp.]